MSCGGAGGQVTDVPVGSPMRGLPVDGFSSVRTEIQELPDLIGLAFGTNLIVRHSRHELGRQAEATGRQNRLCGKTAFASLV